MDIRSYFGSSASSSASSTSCGAEEPEPDSDIDEPPSKKTRSLTSIPKTGRSSLAGWCTTGTLMVLFAMFVKTIP